MYLFLKTWLSLVIMGTAQGVGPGAMDDDDDEDVEIKVDKDEVDGYTTKITVSLFLKIKIY
jgi:hypothetical protein